MKWTEQERFYRCRGDDRLFDKVIKTAVNYEKGIEEAEKKQQELLKSSPNKMGQINMNNMNLNNADSSRVNQSNAKINDNDVSHIGNDIIKINPKTKEPNPIDVSMSQGNQTRQNFSQIGGNQNQTLGQSALA